MTPRNIILLLFLVCLSACAAMTSKEPPPTTYVLHPSEGHAAPAPTAQSAKVLIVPEPQVPEGFKSDQIALYLQDGRQMDYFKGAKWPSDLDKVLQDFIIRSARPSWPRMIVATPDFGVPAAYRLAVKVTDFQPVYKSGPDSLPQLKVSLSFTLITLPAAKIAADFTIAKTAMASANNLTAVTAGLESLLRGILAEAFRKMPRYFQSAPAEAENGSGESPEKSPAPKKESSGLQ